MAGYMEVIICVGGEDDKVVLRSVEMFDPDSLRWKPLACLPFAISKHGMVSSGNYRLIKNAEPHIFKQIHSTSYLEIVTASSENRKRSS